MDRINPTTKNLADEKFQWLVEKFPEAVTESYDADGKLVRAIDRDKLMQEISHYVVDGPKERYQFTWPGKRDAILTANAPIAKVLRPCKEESVDFDTTENLYIEGDNLDVLKMLRETYLGKVKMIYIDPPYNTGNDFVYEDDFARNIDDYIENSGQYDEKGNRIVKNIETNGHFHTDWLNMIYSRLKIAKDLLSDDGVIFISIDDGELANLITVCNEIWGERNFISTIIWERAYAPVNLKKHFSVSHDYIICYTRNITNCICNGLPRGKGTNTPYGNPDNDPRGLWRSDNLSVGPAIPKKVYEIITPSGRSVLPPAGRCWLYTKEKFAQMIKENRIWFGKSGSNVPSIKRFLSEVKNTITPMSVWHYTEVGHSQDAAKSLKKLFDDKSVFSYPKPTELIKRCLELYSNRDSLILDFFSGSATTAHATMQLNAEDGGHRKFIMVQLPEVCGEDTEAHKAGYKNICEIGKERIRRAGKKIKADLEASISAAQSKLDKLNESTTKEPELFKDEKIQQQMAELQQTIKEKTVRLASLDTGFRVLKCDSSNEKDVSITLSNTPPILMIYSAA